MGEIAEMMLSGSMCSCCGEILGSDGDGYPRPCRSCATSERERRPHEEQPFFVRRRGDLAKLETWLGPRQFNCGGYFRDDRKGNPMVTIGYDTDPDNDWKLPEKRGLIIITDHSLRDAVEAMVKRLAKP